MKNIFTLFFLITISFSVKAQDTLGCIVSASFTYTTDDDNAYFTNTSMGEPDGVMYDWWIGDVFSTDENPIVSLDDLDDAETVCFTVHNDDYSCFDSLCTYIYFSEDSVVVDTGCFVNANYTYAFIGDNVYFTNTSTDEPDDAMYSWWIGDIYSSDENPIIALDELDGLETICLMVYNADYSCYDSLCNDIYIDDTAGVDSTCTLNASFTYSILGDNVYFINLSTDEPVDAMYAWWIGDIYSTDENPIVPLDEMEDFEYVCLTVYNVDYSCYDSLCYNYYYFEDSLGIDSLCYLAVNFTYSISGDDVYFTNTSTDEPDGAMYYWTIGDESSSDENPVVSLADFDGIESVCLTVYNLDYSCFDTLCLDIDFDDSTASLIENKALNFNYYPNPATTQLTIEFASSNGLKEIYLHNPLGELILVDNLENNEGIITIDISNLPNGLYIITIFDPSNSSSSQQQKFVKH